MSQVMRAGDQLPAGLGAATVMPTLDGETYSAAGFAWDPVRQKWGSLPGLSNQNRGIGAVGVRNYVLHESFRLLCLSYDLHDGCGPRRWKAGDPPPLELFHYIAAGGLIEAHNSSFEWTWWNFYCVPKLGWPPLPLEQLRCSMAKARASGYPGALGELCDVLQTKHRKDPNGEKLIKLLTVPCNPTKKFPYTQRTPETHPELFAQLYDYCERDIVAESEASALVADLTPYELEIWQCDQRINMRGVALNRQAIDDCIAVVEQCVARGNAELASITNGEVREYTEAARLLAWVNRAGTNMYSMDEDAVAETLTKYGDRLHPKVARALTIRQELGFSSVKKLYAMRAQITADGRLYDQYTYYGAHTSLWNGRAVQLANLYSGKFHTPAEVREALDVISAQSMELVEYRYGLGSALEIVACCLRSMLIAGPGKELVCSDFTAIQAVVLAFLAREPWRMEVFRTHGKIYEASIARLMGVDPDEVIGHKKRTGQHHPMRQTGKIAELSGGFGAWVNGWKQFGAADIIGSDEQIKQAILKWRAASPMVVELWGGQSRGRFDSARPELFGLEGAAISAVKNPGECFEYHGVRYQMHGDALYCMPPTNTGCMVYHSPRLAPSTRDYANPWELELSYVGKNSNAAKGGAGWVRMFLYGGVLTQNVVSFMARQPQAQGLVRLEQHGYIPVAHTHDEIGSEVAAGFGSVEEYEGLMAPRNEWFVANSVPVRANGGWRETMNGKWEF